MKRGHAMVDQTPNWSGPRYVPPVPRTSLIGRDADLATLHALLDEPGVPLVTLNGPGGVGKTHLALVLAEDVIDRFADGVLYLPLAEITQPDQLLSAIGRALGVGEGNRPLIERLAARLRTRQLLMVLDNFEHLIAAGPLVSDLLRTAPGLKMVITSRIALRVTGEHLFVVRPLPVPTLASSGDVYDVWESPAVKLFLARARAARTDFTVTDADAAPIAEICRRLDGLPLAIELAAAQTPHLRPDAMLARMEPALGFLVDGPGDAPVRLQTMRQAIAWSYDLLRPAERALFRRVSVFVGGFTLRMAEDLADGWNPDDGYPYPRDVETRAASPSLGKEAPSAASDEWFPMSLAPLDVNVAGGIWTLIRHSLVQPAADMAGDDRYELLETIRAFGYEQLTQSGEAAAVHHAHMAMMLRFAEIAGSRLWAGDVARWEGRLEAELGNIRAAHEWLLDQGSAANQLNFRLSDSIWFFWQLRGHVSEGRAWIETALSRPGGTSAARAAALNVVGLLAWIQGDDQRAVEALEQSLPIFRALDYHEGIGRCLFALSLVAWRKREYQRMLDLAQEALAHFQLTDDTVGPAVSVLASAMGARGLGDVTRAVELLYDAEARCRNAGFEWGLATATYYKGELARHAGDTAQAVDLLRQALRSYSGQRDPWGMGTCLVALATLTAERGDLVRAARLFGAGFALCEEIGAFIPPTELTDYQTAASAVRDQLGEPVFLAESTLGHALPRQQVITAALDDSVDLVPLMRSDDLEPPVIKNIQIKDYHFTPVQMDVLRMLVAGKEVKEIAVARHCGRSTIYEHIEHIGERLGVSGQKEIIAYTLRNNLL
jgi:predicted ATPase/DNA-binding CsgD family transcriptional regulator